MSDRIAALEHENAELKTQLSIVRQVLNTPIIEPFAEAVVCEARHQIARWGQDHDKHKDPWDWFWTLGYLGSKAARSASDGDIAKALHHTVTAAAMLANWHRFLMLHTPEPGVMTEEELLHGLEPLLAHNKTPSEQGGASA